MKALRKNFPNHSCGSELWCIISTESNSPVITICNCLTTANKQTKRA